MEATEILEAYSVMKRENEVLKWRVQRLSADLKYQEAENRRFRRVLKIYLAASDENALVPKYSRSKANEMALAIMQEGQNGTTEA